MTLNPHRLPRRTPRLALSMALLLLAVAVHADEVTIAQPLVELRYDGNADYAYFIGAARWGAPSCPNAYFAQITTGVAGRKQLLAIALAAKLAGTKVSFQGTCSTDSNYFNVNYVVVGS